MLKDFSSNDTRKLMLDIESLKRPSCFGFGDMVFPKIAMNHMFDIVRKMFDKINDLEVSLTNRTNKCTLEISELSLKAVTRASKITVLEDTIKGHEGVIEAYKLASKGMVAGSKKLHAEITSLKVKNNELTRKLSSCEKDILSYSQIETNYRDIKELQAASKKTITSLRNSNDQLLSEVDELKLIKTSKDTGSLIKRHTADLNTLDTQHGNEVKKLKDEISNLKDELKLAKSGKKKPNASRLSCKVVKEIRELVTPSNQQVNIFCSLHGISKRSFYNIRNKTTYKNCK